MGVEDQQETASPDVSDTPDDQTQVEQSTASDEVGAESSPAAAEGEDKRDLLSVVRDATATKKGAQPASPTGESDESDDTDESSTKSEDADEPDDENFSDVPFHKHPRFQQVIAQRNQYREGYEAYQNVQGFLRQHGLSAEDAANALELHGLLKSNPDEAWKRLKPIAQEVLQKTGQILPPDLKDRVQKGELKRDDALQIARARVADNLHTSRQQHEQQIQQSQEAVDRQKAMQGAAAQWETAQRSKPDSDFDKVAEDVQREVLWLQRRDGMPKDAAGVTRMLDDALKSVRSRRRSTERKPPVNPVRGGQVASGATKAKPSSVLEIVQRASAAG